MDNTHSMDRKIERPWWKRNQRMLGLGVGVLMIGLMGFWFSRAGTSRMNVARERLIMDTIHRGNFAEFITVFGVVEPIQTVFLDAVESGRVEEVFLENGAKVGRQEKIMRLSNRDLQLSVLNQEAQIITQINNLRNLSVVMERQTLTYKEMALDVEFQLDQIEKQARRNEALVRDQVIPQVEYEEVQDQYEHLLRRRKLMTETVAKDSLSQLIQQEQMESSLDLMKRNLEFARTSLENLTVKAPIAGQVSSLNVEIGQMINRGERIAQIDVLDEFKVRASIDEFYINRISLELEGTLTVDQTDYDLKVHRIYPEVENGSFAVDLLFVEAVPPLIRRGQTLSIKLSMSSAAEATLLAKGGHYQTTGGNWIYVVEPEAGIAYRREIRIGRQNPNYYEVEEGLYPGDLVIISSYEYFGEKDQLILKD